MLSNEFGFDLDKRAFLKCQMLLRLIFALMQALGGEFVRRKVVLSCLFFKVIDLRIDTFIKFIYKNILHISS